MANSNGWGDGSVNNDIGWGQGADNAIGWGAIYADSWAGATDIVGTPAVDPDAQAFITAASITDPTQQSAINTLVVDLKGYNIWNKMKAIYPFCGSTASQQKWNLKDPRDLDVAFRLVFNGGWNHSNLGATPNGVNAFANTYYKSVTNMNPISHSYGIYSRTNDTSGTQVYGMYQGSGGEIIQNNLSNGNFIDGYFGNTITYTANPTTSLIMMTRRSNTDWQAYRAGISLGTNTTGCSFYTGIDFFFGARNTGSGTAAFFTNHQLAFAFLSDGLLHSEASNLYTAVQAFQTTLGRQV